MPQMLANIGTYASSPSVKGLETVVGAGSNIAGTIDNMMQQNAYSNSQSYLRNLATNPVAFQEAAQKYVQPLNQGLVTAVTNATNSQLAERGLGGSSAITQATLAQALAPYIAQNQQQGRSDLLNALGLLGGTKPTGQNGFTDISKLLAQLKAGGSANSTPQSLNLNGADPLGLNAPQDTAPTPMMPMGGGFDLSSLLSSLPTTTTPTVTLGG